MKAQNLQVKRGQVPITTSVFQGVLASQVLWAIHFDDQFCPWREEIHNVLTDGFLAIELDAKKLSISQARPKSRPCPAHSSAIEIPPSPPFSKGGLKLAHLSPHGGEGRHRA